MASYRSGMLWAIMFLAIHGGCADSDTIKNACSDATDRDFCISSLSNARGALQADLTQLSVIAVELPSGAVNDVTALILNLRKEYPSVSALIDCSDLLAETGMRVDGSLSKLRQLSNANLNGYLSDVQRFLSATESNQGTCVTGLEESNAPATLVSTVNQNTDNLTKLITDALAVVSKLKQQGHI